MKRLKSILTVLLIFVCGVIVGGIMGSGATMHDFVNKTFRDGPPNIRRVLLQRAKHDLKLDDDQAHQFWQIFNETGGELREVLQPVLPQIAAVFNKAEGRLRNVLNQGQADAFNRFMKTARSRWETAVKQDSTTIEAQL